MGGGRKACAVLLGNHMSSDTIDIFDYAEPKLVGSVDEQKEFYEKWVESIKRAR